MMLRIFSQYRPINLLRIFQLIKLMQRNAEIMSKLDIIRTVDHHAATHLYSISKLPQIKQQSN
ncbi:hypothetical protein GQ57_08460 [Burkholderia sp. MSh2]|nr:hypothetical protein GQ57_08460 [Burkholderia sp. MSh2]KFG92554.1 hypothetical protein GQ56_0136650 [Burkholderia paludis]